jgi:hypothetical protein
MQSRFAAMSTYPMVNPNGKHNHPSPPTLQFGAELRHLGLAARMRECLASPLRSTKQEDFAFFRMVLECGNK